MTEGSLLRDLVVLFAAVIAVRLSCFTLATAGVVAILHIAFSGRV